MARLSAITLLLLTCSTAGWSAETAIDADKISAIWKARQERVKSIEMRCTCTTYLPKGSYSLGLPPSKVGGLTLPESDLKKEGLKTRLVVDGNKVREEHESYVWDPNSKQFMVLGTKTAFDGEVTYDIDFIGFKSPDDPGSGRVTRFFKSFRDPDRPRFRVLFGAFRAASSGLRPWNPHDLAPTGRRAVIRESECIECVIGKYPRGGSNTIWVDPAKEYLVVRQILEDAVARDRTQLDVTYQRHPEAGWVPLKWENSRTATRDGRPGVSDHYKVDEIRINETISQSEFKLTFPPGMTVLDNIETGGPEGRIQSDGTFKPDGADSSYDLPGNGNSQSRNKNLLFIITGTLVLAGTAFLIRFVRRRKSSASHPLNKENGL
jgi:hypothetical protein